tara:strand:- start:2337 stop:2699 length:363 start_codon:yes stop_codon:yes gene_type:complete
VNYEEFLCQFSSPRDASERGGVGRTAGYHWYREGEGRLYPRVEVLVRMSDYLGLTDSELGELVRDYVGKKSGYENEFIVEPRRPRYRARGEVERYDFEEEEVRSKLSRLAELSSELLKSF